MTRHAYYNCLTLDGGPIPWDPRESLAEWVGGESEYFARVFALIDEQLHGRRLTFYLTSSNDHLPNYGPDVVAVVVADELFRIPAYSDKVAAVFKNHGIRPRLGCWPLREPSLVNLRSLLVFLLRCIRYLPSASSYLMRRLRARRPAPLYEIPVGTFNQRDLPVPSISDRPVDVFFGGSINQGRLPGTPCRPRWESIREWLGPKTAARREMVTQMRNIVRTRPDLIVEVLEAPSYLHAYESDPDLYSHKLLDAKISLVPRGTSPQTFRFFQSLRAGCIVITDVLPSQWFMSDAPVTLLKQWSDLGPAVESLLADPALLARRQREALDWWESRCSERAVAAFIVSRLDKLPA